MEEEIAEFEEKIRNKTITEAEILYYLSLIEHVELPKDEEKDC